jgi:hypothetical protein
MTSQRLYEILKFFDALDTKLNLQKTLESIRDALNNLVNQPAQPQLQNVLATNLASFEAAAGKLDDLITPSQFEAIDDMGGYDFFDPAIAENVKSSIQKNAMTPSVARDFVQDLATKRAAFLATVREARQSLEKLGIKTSALQSGSADLAFLIPRDIFDNHLAAFAKELTFISRLMGHFSEALTGKAEQVELEQLSSSVPTVALVASVPVISVLATIVNKFLDAWAKVEKIRKMRADLSDMGLKKTALDELTEQITTTVDEVVEEATEIVLVNYTGSPERKNELSNAVRQDTHRLFGQIERGLTVEFRAVPSKEEKSEEGKALANISNLSRVIQFPQIPKEPMLLSSGQILEGDIQAVKHTKKTTTHKTTTSKKLVGKEDKPEAKEEH